MVDVDRIGEWQHHADARFDRLDEWQRSADARFERLEEWQRSADARFDRIEDWQRHADRGFDRIDQRFDVVETTMTRGFEELGRQMRLLREDALDRLKDASEREAPTRSEMSRAIASAHEMPNVRLETLETVVKQHGQEIDELKRRS